MFGCKKFKSILVAALFTLCLALLPIIALNFSGVADLPQQNAAPIQAEKNVYKSASPYRGYTFLDVSAANGYTPYANVTTVEGLKKNLVVRGSTDSSMTIIANSPVLNGEEYDILINGIKAENGDKVATEAGTIAVTVVCGSVTADIPLTVVDLPTLSGAVTFTAANVTDDYTADTIYRALTVKAGSTTLTPDLYTVSISPENLYNQSSVNITVMPLEGLGLTAPAPQNVNVTKARLSGISLSVKSEYTLQDGRYKNAAGEDAFIVDMTPYAAFQNIDVYALFANGRVKMTLKESTYGTIDGQTETGESVSTNFRQNATTDTKIDITLNRNGASASGELQVTWAQPEIVAIEVDAAKLADWNASTDSSTGTKLYSYTTLTPAILSQFVTLRRNTGDTIGINADNLTVGSLTPTAKDISDYGAAADKDNFTYTKTITLTSGSVTTTVEIGKIHYAAPTSLGGINRPAAPMPPQIKHHEFDLTGWTVTLQYGRGKGDAVANLSDFDKSYLTIELSAGLSPQKGTIIQDDTDNAYLTFRYNGLTAVSDFNFEAQNDRIDIPEASSLDMYYSNGCGTTFKGFNPEIMTIGVYSDAACDEEHDVTKDKGEGETATKATASVNQSTGEVTYKEGAEFYVKISLKSDAANTDAGHEHDSFPIKEYEFYSSSLPVGVSIVDAESFEKSAVVYRVQVRRGSLAVSASVNKDGEGKDVKIEYGDNVYDKITVTGTTNGRINTLVNDENATVQSGQLAVPYKLLFYALDASGNESPNRYTSDNRYDNSQGVSNPNAGTYHVYVVTADTNAYLHSESRVGSYITVTIEKKEISLSAVNSVTFDQKDHTAKDFISAGDNFVGSDTADTVLSIVNSGTGTKFDTVKHADTYKVTVAISSATMPGKDVKYRDNYMLEGGDSSENVDFVIEQAEFDFDADASSAADIDYGGTAEPALTVKQKTDKPFYAKENAVQYYKGTSVASGTLVDVKDIKTWAAGDYIAYITTSPADGDVAADYVKLPDFGA